MITPAAMSVVLVVDWLGAGVVTVSGGCVKTPPNKDGGASKSNETG